MDIISFGKDKSLHTPEGVGELLGHLLAKGWHLDKIEHDLSRALHNPHEAKRLINAGFDHLLSNLKDSREKQLIVLIGKYREIAQKAMQYAKENSKDRAACLKTAMDASHKIADLLRLKDLVDGKDDEQKPFQIEIIKPKAE